MKNCAVIVAVFFLFGLLRFVPAQSPTKTAGYGSTVEVPATATAKDSAALAAPQSYGAGSSGYNSSQPSRYPSTVAKKSPTVSKTGVVDLSDTKQLTAAYVQAVCQLAAIQAKLEAQVEIHRLTIQNAELRTQLAAQAASSQSQRLVQQALAENKQLKERMAKLELLLTPRRSTPAIYSGPSYSPHYREEYRPRPTQVSPPTRTPSKTSKASKSSKPRTSNTPRIVPAPSTSVPLYRGGTTPAPTFDPYQSKPQANPYYPQYQPAPTNPTSKATKAVSPGVPGQKSTTTNTDPGVISSEDMRQILQIWERIWNLKSPPHVQPMRVHGGVI